MRTSYPQNPKHSFSMIPKAEIPRSSIDRSRGVKTTFTAGYLTPVFIDEVLPGDTYSCSTTCFGRVATLEHPVMDNIYLDFFFFFVPNRLLWQNWERFNGAQDDPDSTTDYLIPVMTSPGAGGYTSGSLQDHMGLPPGIPNLEHSALFTRAYNLVWNTWFRDQNLQDSITVDLDDGPDTPGDYILRKRGKRHDYFTSCLPWPQKGDAVTLPLGTSAALSGIVYPAEKAATDGAPTWDFANVTNRNLFAQPGVNEIEYGGGLATANFAVPLSWNDPKLQVNLAGGVADLTTATAATINQLRQAFQIQRLYERDARGGTRYTEIVLSHFGVTSDDARLQRPEFLGGGTRPLMVTPVPQTAVAASDVTPIGTLKAYGTVQGGGLSWSKSFTEHGVLIGLVAARADLNYQQGLHRMWSRRTRWDFYWPALAHLGEQAVLNKEIYAQGSVNPTADAAVFGYQERFAEYRYGVNTISGRLRSNDAATLDVWHLAQDFASLPVLGPTFIEENPPMARIKNVGSIEPDFIFDCWHRVTCARPMPTFSVPGLIDHF